MVKSNKGTDATVKWQDGIDQYVFKDGERSADEATIWQQKAYDDHLIREARHQLLNGRTTPKVVMDREDTTMSGGSRIEEIGSAFHLHAPKGKGKEKET